MKAIVNTLIDELMQTNNTYQKKKKDNNKKLSFSLHLQSRYPYERISLLGLRRFRFQRNDA